MATGDQGITQALQALSQPNADTNSPTPTPAPTADSAPSPYSDLRAISTYIDKHLDIDKTAHPIFARDWFRNVLFDHGIQWIIEDAGKKKWRQRSLPGWFPRAQTNKF